MTQITRIAGLYCIVLLLLPTATSGAAPAKGKAQRPPIKWNQEIDWKTWEEGSKLAEKSGRAICLVVYADWCPQCRKLAPVFQDEQLVALSKDLVMVLQDNDEKPKWLQERYGRLGGYVPRIFFLDSRGNLVEDLTGGHAKYPHYYWPGNEKLAANMKKAASR